MDSSAQWAQSLLKAPRHCFLFCRSERDTFSFESFVAVFFSISAWGLRFLAFFVPFLYCSISAGAFLLFLSSAAELLWTEHLDV